MNDEWSDLRALAREAIEHQQRDIWMPPYLLKELLDELGRLAKQYDGADYECKQWHDKWSELSAINARQERAIEVLMQSAEAHDRFDAERILKGEE